MNLEILKVNFLRLRRCFPDGFVQVRIKNDNIYFHIGDATLQLDKDFNFIGCGRCTGDWTDWKIEKKESQVDADFNVKQSPPPGLTE